MKSPLRSRFVAAFLALVSPLAALAHPGHGDPDFTWEFRHLAAHPLATAGCIVVLAAGFWGLAWIFHRLRQPRRSR
jgi:hypothetical protein